MNQGALILFDNNKKMAALQAVQGEQKSTALQSFKNISSMINTSVGNVPPRVVPMLQHLTTSYSLVNTKVKSGLASTSAATTKFLVKSARLLQYGYDDGKLLELKSFAEKINGDYVRELDLFIESSREDLITIAVQLTGEAKGGRAEGLELKRKELEKDLNTLIVERGSLQIQVGEAEGNIVSLRMRITFLNRTKNDKAAAKEALSAEIHQLTARIPEYEAEVARRRDTHYEERSGFWIFSWKVRDVHVNNGEQIARENLNRLLSQIDQAKALLNGIDEKDVQQELEAAEKSIPPEEKKVLALNEQIEKKSEAIQRVQTEFYQVVKELEELYQTAGTANLEALKTVDTLARGVRDGVNSLTDAYAVIKENLLTIDHDPDLLIASVRAGTHLLALSDEFTGGRALENVKASYLTLQSE